MVKVGHYLTGPVKTCLDCLLREVKLFRNFEIAVVAKSEEAKTASVVYRELLKCSLNQVIKGHSIFKCVPILYSPAEAVWLRCETLLGA